MTFKEKISALKNKFWGWFDSLQNVYIAELHAMCVADMTWYYDLHQDIKEENTMLIDTPFSKDLVHIFLTRVSFLLNKIHQARLADFACAEFTWHYEEPYDDECINSFIIIHGRNNEDIRIDWSGDLDRSLATIKSDKLFLNELDVGDNLAEFTRIEMYVVKKLIELEKEAIEAAAPVIEFKEREGESSVPSLAEELGKNANG
jgi:hypothetical protein